MRYLLIPAIVSLGAACLLGGCISGSADVKMSGRHIGAATISQIEPGHTTQSWVRATLGDPTSIATATNAEGESEIWRYEWNVRKKSSGYVFPVVAGSANVEYNGVAYVEFEDGVVVRAWRDSSVSDLNDDCDDDDCDDADVEHDSRDRNDDEHHVPEVYATQATA
jgi:outer membrane protein assembly factor BamE (lipoprotein component of BamABCDE complex)